MSCSQTTTTNTYNLCKPHMIFRVITIHNISLTTNPYNTTQPCWTPQWWRSIPFFLIYSYRISPNKWRKKKLWLSFVLQSKLPTSTSLQATKSSTSLLLTNLNLTRMKKSSASWGYNHSKTAPKYPCSDLQTHQILV